MSAVSVVRFSLGIAFFGSVQFDCARSHRNCVREHGLLETASTDLRHSRSMLERDAGKRDLECGSSVASGLSLSFADLFLK